MPYEHLRLRRSEPLTDRHRRQFKRPRFNPDDPRAYGVALGVRLQAANQVIRDDLGGFDNRRLLKIQLREGEQLPSVDTIPGIEVVSQEDESVVLAFATSEGLDTIEQRLATLAQTGNVTRRDLLYAIEDFSRWTPDDRTGNALREQGMPDLPIFILDVELWPIEHIENRRQMLDTFRQWLPASPGNRGMPDRLDAQVTRSSVG